MDCSDSRVYKIPMQDKCGYFSASNLTVCEYTEHNLIKIKLIYNDASHNSKTNYEPL